MGQISVDLTDAEPQENLKKEGEKLRKLATGLPSAGKARAEGLRYAPRVNWSFTNIPAPIKERAATRADELGMGIKEFFYHCLRLGGVDIPEDETIDARRR